MTKLSPTPKDIAVVNRRRQPSFSQVSLSLLTRALLIYKSAWAFNVAKWKRQLLRQYLPRHIVRYGALKDSVYAKHRAIQASPRPVFVVWGMIEPEDLQEYAEEFGIPIIRIEDGLFRSIGLGANHNLPYSLCLDKSGIYFDASKPSDLENILLEYQFRDNSSLMRDAVECMNNIREYGLSKYNEVFTSSAPTLYGPKFSPRILVVGQVEDDQSLLYGCNKIMTNVELIEFAARENPDAQIIYKPHPDVIAGKRNEISDPSKVTHLADILPFPLSLKDALHQVDRVYTQTSLAGFEALIHGVPVTTTGAPFYSGWGLTDDRQVVSRRTRKLELEQVFAGAYLLYPKYRNAITKRKSSLTKTIEFFKEELALRKIVKAQTLLDRLNMVNLATKRPVGSRYLYQSLAKSVAIISDSPEALTYAKALAAKGKYVTLIATRDALANDEVMMLSPEDGENIVVTSIHKRYSVPLSATEAESVELVQALSAELKSALSDMAGGLLKGGVIDALTGGLDDYIYFEILRFFACRRMLSEFDSILVLVDEIDSTLDCMKSLQFHGEEGGSLGRIYCAVLSGQTKNYVSEYLSHTKPGFSSPTDIEQLRTKFSSFWWDLRHFVDDEYDGLGKHIAICGNIQNDNYAYAPSALKLMETLVRNSALPLIYYSSGLLSADGQDAVKGVNLSESLASRCVVYSGCSARFQKKYPINVVDKSSEILDPLFETIIERMRSRMPEKFIGILASRVYKFVRSLGTQLIFAAEAERLMNSTKLFATAMERSVISRILTATARDCGVPSIGIQPQIISISPRYLRHTVDRMGVINAHQKSVYSKLGSKEDSLVAIGSVNIISRLRKIAATDADMKGTADKIYDVFFVMQHSTSSEMLATAHALKVISEKAGFTVLVKPHPHQELPVVNEIRRIFANSTNVKIMNKGADTYQGLSRTRIVVGLFSSVLLEAALSGRTVIVAAFSALDPSIDFSLQGLAMKANNATELVNLIDDALNGGVRSTELALQRKGYIEANPQFEAPYGYSRFEQFVAAALI